MLGVAPLLTLFAVCTHGITFTFDAGNGDAAAWGLTDASCTAFGGMGLAGNGFASTTVALPAPHTSLIVSFEAILVDAWPSDGAIVVRVDGVMAAALPAAQGTAVGDTCGVRDSRLPISTLVSHSAASVVVALSSSPTTHSFALDNVTIAAWPASPTAASPQDSSGEQWWEDSDVVINVSVLVACALFPLLYFVRWCQPGDRLSSKKLPKDAFVWLLHNSFPSVVHLVSRGALPAVFIAAQAVIAGAIWHRFYTVGFTDEFSLDDGSTLSPCPKTLPKVASVAILVVVVLLCFSEAWSAHMHTLYWRRQLRRLNKDGAAVLACAAVLPEQQIVQDVPVFTHRQVRIRHHLAVFLFLPLRLFVTVAVLVASIFTLRARCSQFVEVIISGLSFTFLIGLDNEAWAVARLISPAPRYLPLRPAHSVQSRVVTIFMTVGGLAAAIWGLQDGWR